jgi:ABC-type phosphate/phosphonate transport system substrate-binding protein
MRLVANARMYAVAPAVAEAWRALFAWVARAADVALDYVEHAAPAPLSELWVRPDLGCAFMCGWPFARSTPQPRLLAAPIPAPPRYARRPIYFTDLVVRADSSFMTLEDTFGHRLAYTTEDSQSGFNAVRHHLFAFRTSERPRLYREIVGPVVTPRASIAAVLEGRADVAPLDSYVHELLRLHAPELTARLHVVATTAAAPIPPLIAGPACDDVDAARIGAALRRVGDEQALTALRTALCLAGFAAATPADYVLTEARAAAAVAAGYAELA